MPKIFSGIFILFVLAFIMPQARAQMTGNVGPRMVMDGTVGAYADSLWAAIIDPQSGSYIGSPARISKGAFRIVTTIPSPSLYVLMIGNPQEQATLKYYNIFLSNEPTVLQVADNKTEIIISVGPSAIAFQALAQQMGGEFEQLNKLTQMKESAGTYGYSPDSIANARKQVLHQLQNKIPLYLQAHHQTEVAPFLLNIVLPLNFPLSEMEAWMAMITPAAMNTLYGNALVEMVQVEKVLGYGQVAPVFTQNDPNGAPVSLSTFKGQYVLIDFWASWCGPCRQENPNVVKAHERFKSKNFTVLGVSLDKDKMKWMQAIQADNLAWTQVSDLGFWNNAVAKMYRVSSIPQNYLLDPEGRIIGKNLRGDELNDFLEKTLSNN